MNNTFFSDARFSDQSVRTSQNSKELQERNLNSKPSQELTTPPQATASSTKIQTSGETQISPIKTRVSSEKPHLTEQELKRTVENAKLPNKT